MLLLGLPLASSGSLLEPADIGSVARGGRSQQPLTPVDPLLPKACQANPLHGTNVRKLVWNNSVPGRETVAVSGGCSSLNR